MIDKIISALVLTIFAIIIFTFNYTYIHPMVSDDMIYCDEMRDQGYFSLHDYTHHKNCTIELKEGPSECDWIQKKFLSDEDEWYCFNYEDYDDECEFDRSDYGRRCVWGGLGWMLFGLRVALYAFSVMTLFMAGAILFSIKHEYRVAM